MPHLELLVAAEGHSVDQVTNALSIFNILERVQGAGSGFFPHVEVITVFGRADGDVGRDFQALLRINNRSGQVGPDYPMNFQMNSERHRLFHVLYGLPIAADAGFIRFDLQLNGEPVGSYRIDIDPGQQPPVG